ncbi:head GIN domain-containing protein [Ferruginibacter sp.]|uniref:head GIN domain-containing protein n=1 Tax=Ferruginibacter sp. TaxID=1940288 RepID=UPI00265ABAB8|nr:head GIN domain-containing protein [Ferruginibacter sp.]
MKKIILSLAILTATVAGQGQNKVFVNDANAQLRILTGSFNAIKISGGIDLYLSQFDAESIAVSAAEDKYKEHIKTVVENNTLKIYYEGDKIWSGGNKKLKVYVSFKNLEKLQASGASDVHLAGTINVPSLALDMSGASDFKGAVKVNDLIIELSGASDATISGVTNTVSIYSTGASDFKGYNLVTDICNAKASGASDIHITVNKEISADASGASDISYRGNAVIKNQHSSGASSIGRKGK